MKRGTINGMLPMATVLLVIAPNAHAASTCSPNTRSLNAVAKQQEQPDSSRLGVGWRIERADVEVSVLPAERRIEVEGVMHLVLEGIDRSFGPSIAMNSRQDLMTFDRLTGPKGAHIDTGARNPDHPEAVIAHIRLDDPVVRGAKISLEFAYSSKGESSQFIIAPQGALVSWTDAWMPFALPRVDLGEGLTARTLSYVGDTTLRLPPGWSAISDGDLTRSDETTEGIVERWSLNEPVARSFCAGPYEIATRTVAGRTIRVAMLQGEKAISVDRLAELLSGALAAQEAKLGPFPFSSYGVAEIPGEIATTWYAASQQTFIMAQSSAFDWEHGNLPLWGHEMSHGWWGNTVSTEGPGSKWCSESLAQLGALIAIEALEGDEAAREFLGYSRSGYSTLQSAMGYFWMWSQGKDKPIAELGESGDDHSLSDNKGYWVYHMLREEIGDGLFFDVLRGLIRDFAGKDMTVQDVRSAFIEAAPQHDLESFFAQWLDRGGAPVLEMKWHGVNRGTGISIVVRQVQDGEPFAFDLDIEIQFLDGSSRIETVHIDSVEHQFEFEISGRAESVRLDPDYRVLIYRPGYGPSPVD